MNTLIGLKKLLAKLGGNPAEVNTNGEAINAIAESYADHVGAVIDDEHSSTDTTYSSSKIESVAGDKLPELTSTDKKCFLVSTGTSNPTWIKTPPLVVGGGVINNDQTAVTNLYFETGVTREDVTKPVSNGNLNMPNAWLLLFDQTGNPIDMERVCFGAGGFAVFVGYTVNKVGDDFIWKKYTFIMHRNNDSYNSFKVEEFTW